jgi:hypothetical protein
MTRASRQVVDEREGCQRASGVAKARGGSERRR